MRRHVPDSPVGLTGSEAVEFLDIPSMGEMLHSGPAFARPEPREPQLNEAAQSNIARQAYEYISRLVRDHHGDEEDVWSVVKVLQSDRTTTES
jgi:hypothetical protein